MKSNISQLLVHEQISPAIVIKPHLEVKIYNEKEKVFLDVQEHAIRGNLHERADKTEILNIYLSLHCYKFTSFQ